MRNRLKRPASPPNGPSKRVASKRNLKSTDAHSSPTKVTNRTEVTQTLPSFNVGELIDARDSSNTLLQALFNIQHEEEYDEEIKMVRVVDASDAEFAPIPDLVPQAVKDGLLEFRNIKQLYKHQTLALDHLFEGENVVICTGTSR